MGHCAASLSSPSITNTILLWDRLLGKVVTQPHPEWSLTPGSGSEHMAFSGCDMTLNKVAT